jgi:hypothetical protein
MKLATLASVTLLIACHEQLLAEGHPASDTQTVTARLHGIHVLGFENVPANANGTVSIQDDHLRFQKDEGSSEQIPLTSIRSLTLGTQDKQVGGIPMTVVKTAAPYGGGRVISLFSHKKYESVTLEYVDGKGGLHGAIFLLNKGEGDSLRSALESAGVRTGTESAPENRNDVQ